MFSLLSQFVRWICCTAVYTCSFSCLFTHSPSFSMFSSPNPSVCLFSLLCSVLLRFEFGFVNAILRMLDMQMPGRLLCCVYCSFHSLLQRKGAPFRNGPPLYRSSIPLCWGCTSSLEWHILNYWCMCVFFCVFKRLPQSYPRSYKKKFGDKFGLF